MRGDPPGSALPTLSVDRARPRAAGGEGDGDDELARALLRGLIAALIAEGRRFAATPAGRRWRRVLAEATLVSEGRLLWSTAGVDLFLRGTDLGPGSPRAMAADILALLGADEERAGPGLVIAVEPPGPGGWTADA